MAIVKLVAAKALVEVDMRKDPFTAKIPPRTTIAPILQTPPFLQTPPMLSPILIFLPKVAILSIF